jgi:hypothetical protein
LHQRFANSRLADNKKRAKKKGDDVARLVLFIAPGLTTLQHKNTAFRFILAFVPAQRSKQEFLRLLLYAKLCHAVPVITARLAPSRKSEL